MSYVVEPAKFLDVDVDELTRMFTLVTEHWLGWLQRCEPIEPRRRRMRPTVAGEMPSSAAICWPV
jgi:hypothetical protein